MMECPRVARELRLSHSAQAQEGLQVAAGWELGAYN